MVPSLADPEEALDVELVESTGSRPCRGRREVSKDEVIRIMCPNLGCQRILGVPPRARGCVVRCRGCGTNIRIPHSENSGGCSGAAEDRPSNERAA